MPEAEVDDSDPRTEIDGALPIDPEWEELAERWFVWGVDEDDVLNVRAAPGATSEVLTALGPDERDVVRFSEVAKVGATDWTPVAIPGGAGWVALRFIKPNPSVAPPIVEGVPMVDGALLDEVLAVIGDPEALAAFVGDEGLVISPYQFVAPDSVKLTADELSTTGADVRVWGERDGVGGPIEATLDQFLADVAGSTALTSTEQIGHDEVLSSGNVINNIALTFPDARVVEYYFGGTEFFVGLDWASVSLVFADDDSLMAIVLGEWTI